MGRYLSFKSSKHVYTACIVVYISGSAGDGLQSTEPSVPPFVHRHVAGAESQPGGEGDVAGSSKSLPAATSGHRPGRKRAAKKRSREILVSTSDDEADTVKDRFWRNLDEGLLPEDLCRVPDMYSGVSYVSCLA